MEIEVWRVQVCDLSLSFLSSWTPDWQILWDQNTSELRFVTGILSDLSHDMAVAEVTWLPLHVTGLVHQEPLESELAGWETRICPPHVFCREGDLCKRRRGEA